MRILVIGGARPGHELTGYDNAVRTIVDTLAVTLAVTDEVFHLPSWFGNPFAATVFKVENNAYSGKNQYIPALRVLSVKTSLRMAFEIVDKLYEALSAANEYSVSMMSEALHILQYSLRRTSIGNALRTLDPDIVHIHGFTFDLLPAYDAVFEKSLPLVATAHGLYSLDENVSTLFDKRLEGDLMRKVIERNGLITAVSSEVRSNIITVFGISSDRVFVVPNGVERERFYCADEATKRVLRKSYELPEDRIIFTTVGTLNKRKNQSLVLEAMSKMDSSLRNQVHYLIVGGGPLKEELVAFARKVGLNDSCTIFGRAEDEDLSHLYSASDFFLLPSTSEGFGLVVLEALASGLPIISFSDIEGVSEWYHPQCVELVVERTPEAMILKIKKAIDKEWDRDWITDYSGRFNWREVCKTYRNIYNKAQEAAN